MTVVEALPEILMSVQHCRNNEQALDQLLKDSGIEFITQACVTVIDERGLAYQRDGQDHRIDADTVVVAAGYSPNDDLYRELAGRVDVSLIGDAANPDSILAAVHQGFHVARSL